MAATQAQCNRADRAAAYVIGELPARSRVAYERHLKVCTVCSDEVELLMNVADAIPLLSATQQPPDPSDQDQHRHAPALAANAQAAAAAAAKAAAAAQPPTPADGKPALQAIRGGPPDPFELRQAAHALRVEAAVLRGGSATTASRIAARAERRPRRPARRILRRPVPGQVLLGFLAVAVVGIATVALSHRAASIRYERVEAGWTRGGAAIRVEGNQLELLVEGMPRAPRGKAYQVWVVERPTGKLVPTTALLRPGRDGDAGLIVPGNYHHWYAVGVYVETLHHPENTKAGAVVVADLRHVP